MTDPEALRKQLIDVARAFNTGHYFEAHELLEDALDSVPDPLWELFVGLVQIAVGYHKVTMHLGSGATKMLERALEKIEPFPADAAGLNVGALRQRVRADIEKLRAGTFEQKTFTRRPPRLQLRV